MARRRLPSLKRGKSKREPKRRFLLFCEGLNTEPAYFDAMERSYADALIGIETVGGVGVPMTIARRATARKRRRRQNSFEMDEVWAIFDRDSHPNFSDAVSMCEANGVGVARSNPCFELWLVLHESEHDRPEGRVEMQKRLAGLCPEYDRRGRKVLNCTDLVDRVELAEERAERQLERRDRQGTSFGNPSTTVGRRQTDEVNSRSEFVGANTQLILMK